MSNANSNDLFLAPSNKDHLDAIDCSSKIPDELNKQSPDIVLVNQNNSDYNLDKNNHEDLSPPCAKQRPTNIEDWRKHWQKDDQ